MTKWVEGAEEKALYTQASGFGHWIDSGAICDKENWGRGAVSGEAAEFTLGALIWRISGLSKSGHLGSMQTCRQRNERPGQRQTD